MKGGVARLSLALALVAVVAGCTVRSISNSGRDGGNPFYQGELSEFAVLGLPPSAAPTDAEIAKALAEHKPVSVARGSTILLIQSGAPLPDDAMMGALSPSFQIVPFSGVPADRVAAGGSPYALPRSPMLNESGAVERASHLDGYARALRLAAAQSGAATILCYWGGLEINVDRGPTKAVSWIPLVGSFVPDEQQEMHIRLKLAVVDVATGHWSEFTPPDFDDKAISAPLNRTSADQGQVADLKAKAYQSAAAEFLRAYAR